MANLQRGSSGEDVKQLQQTLINSGYDVGSAGADGIYGAATESAVRRYQADNGLAVDGIAGVNTMNHINGGGSSAPSPTYSSSDAIFTPYDYDNQRGEALITNYGSGGSNNGGSGFNDNGNIGGSFSSSSSGGYSPYDPMSDAAYQQAIAALQQVQGNAPTYTSTYDSQLRDTYNQIVNRKPFEYDVNQDALYQQYAQQYVEKGRLAMRDTIGQAAALTGGYGSSYGEAVGQQQYDAYLQQLNEVVPELYQMAYGRWQDEGDALMRQYSMLGDLDDREYGRYQDEYNKWLNERDYAQQQADTAYNRGYNQWAVGLEQYNTDRSFEFNQQQADRDYQLALDKFTYAKEQDAVALDAASAGGSVGGSGSSSGGSGGGSYDPEVAQIQRQLNTMGAGLTVDGIWGPRTQAAYDRYMGGSVSNTVETLPSPAQAASNASYTSGELLEASSAGMSKQQIEAALKNRGVDVNSAAVQADIKWAMSK